MFQMMRKVFGPAAITVIIGAIAMVFVFYGVYSPRNARIGGGAVAATVNGDSISMAEYSRDYQQRVDFYQNMMKGKADPNLLRQLGIGRQVIEDLVRRKLLLQAAAKMGLTIPDEEVREKIKELPYFKDKNGVFDTQRYNAILDANHYSPATFEDTIREDLMRERVSELMRSRAKVSEGEVERDFQLQEDRREVDYVAVTPEIGKKLISVSDKEIDALLSNPTQLAAAKGHYESTKPAYVKSEPKAAKKKDKAAPAAPVFYSFEEVQRKVATDMIREKKADEIVKINKEIADQLFAKAKAGTSELKAFAKSQGLELKTSAKYNRTSSFFPQVGELPELITDSFKEPSPLAQGPKLYESGRAFVVAENLKAYKPDMAEYPKQRDKLLKTAIERKEQEMFGNWLSDLREHAKVSMNKSLTDIASADEAPAGAGGPPVEE